MDIQSSQPKVVIIDDDTDLLQMMTYGFKNEGFEVETFTTGKDALEALTDSEYLKTIDLLIVDRLLPDCDGMDIFKKITQSNPGNVPLTLFLSVLSTDSEVLKGIYMGAVDYLSKPFKLNILIDKSKALLSKYKQ